MGVSGAEPEVSAQPAHAPYPGNAHLFIVYVLRPEVAARNSSYLHYPTSNAAAYAVVDPAVNERPQRLLGARNPRASHTIEAAFACVHATAEPHVDAVQVGTLSPADSLTTSEQS
jgi:spermidine/putrescine-binding protein